MTPPRLAVLLLVASLPLLSCSGDDADGGAASAPSAPPTSAGAASEPVDPVEAAVLDLLRAIDPNAATVQDSFDEAFVALTLDGAAIQVHVNPAVGATPGTVESSEDRGGVATDAVRTDALGLVHRFRCDLAEPIGPRQVDLIDSTSPETAVPALHQALRCS